MSEAAEKLDPTEAEQSNDETPAQEAAPEVEVPNHIKPVGVNRFAPAEQKRNHFVVYCKHGTDPESVLQVEFWEHVARWLGRGDLIEVMPEDLAWEMSVRVLDKGHNWALVKKREFFDYGGATKVKSEMPQSYNVDWTGPINKFRVTFNGEKLKDGFATEELARRYAANHAQALKR